MVYIILTSVNSFFRYDKSIYKKDKQTGEQKKFKSTADFYEDKCDTVIRRKYPETVKLLSKIVSILSEFMIMFILIVQGIILLIG